MSIVQLPSDEDTVVLLAEFPAIEPERLFAYWTDPELISEWWPNTAEIVPFVGGAYRLSFKGDREFTMRGHITIYEHGRALGFSWKWDHEPPELPPLQVDLTFTPRESGGAQLTLRHGPYSDSPEDQESRRGVMDGWHFFIARLQNMPVPT